LVEHAEKQKAGRPLRLEELAGEEVTINAANFLTGRFGIYVVMDCVDKNGELIQVMSSGSLVLDALQHATDAKAFPLSAIFVKKGRVWTIE
jgi:hypothetical protein